ncbi:MULTISPECIES: medium chain dehydrogenase/reductase family protein [unclassified Streptomyces]|uniref:quinone oxidoreductase family protein n=1 Tax=unclassified Streptomyces TaxID=2593676 RepID=UPI0003639497|nr:MULTISPECIES: medium chain dehydrogenase/reductase family protein [unclassified Streptomyces]MYT32500.1 zinc-binding dehydrogenase [Streptomyces sp. SID8354]
MLAVYCSRPDSADPLGAVAVGDRRRPPVPDGWTVVRMLTASLNMREITVLGGRAGAGQRYPIILGSDGCGVLDDGTEVVVHASVASPGWAGPESLDPGRTVLSERHDGTFAEFAVVPYRNALPKPPELSAVDAACLSTAWLTAYRMLFVTAGAVSGQTVLVRGRRRLGTIASAAIVLANAAGVRVGVVGEPGDRELALRLGADVFETDSRLLPAPVDAVLDASVSGVGWLDDVAAVRPHGAVVCAGYRAGGETLPQSAADAMRDLVFREIRVLGSGMGTAADLRDLMDFLVTTGVRPTVADVLDIREVGRGMRAMLTGATTGKLVFRIS